MVTVAVHNSEGEPTGSLTLADSVWDVPFNMPLLHQAVTIQRGNKRQGNATTLGKSQLAYSGHKIRNQKGSGRSRQGSLKAPHMRGGAVAHGPQLRSFRRLLPKKMRRQALCVALSQKLRASRVLVVDEVESLTQPKTRQIKSLIDNLKIVGSVMIVTPNLQRILCKSCSNLIAVNVMDARELNPLAVAKSGTLLLTRGAAEQIEQTFGPAQGQSATASAAQETS